MYSGAWEVQQGWPRKLSSYCQRVLLGPPGVLGQWNGPSWASEDPRSLEMRWTKPLVNQEFCGKVRRGWGGQHLSFRCKDGKRLKKDEEKT